MGKSSHTHPIPIPTTEHHAINADSRFGRRLANNYVNRSHDSKAKVWRIETRSCVATHSHGDKPLWSAKWLPKAPGKSEMFALAGGNNSISFYREAAG